MANEGISHADPDRLRSNPSTTGGFAGVEQGVILAIDDDTEVLNSIRRLLIREGWVVLTASDPAEGLQSYEAHWQGIALVLLDYYMPGLRGDEVWERLKRINPQVRVLLMTASDDYLPPRVAQRRSLRFHPKTGHAQGTASADPRGLESPRSAGPFV